ncbi:MAG: metallophosphoesterase family protein [Opitutales bacterium]|nr:metallophosphoesterase family protein [Opitutales bacterium]
MKPTEPLPFRRVFLSWTLQTFRGPFLALVLWAPLLAMAEDDADDETRAAGPLPNEQILLPITAPGRLHDTGEAPPPDWALPGFDDSGWTASSGMVARLERRRGALRRFGQEAPGAELREGGDTAYVRYVFSLEAPPVAGSRLLLNYVAKDGAVFFLNGVEIGRSTAMPPRGPVDHQTRALFAPSMRLKTGFDIDPALLRAGENVLGMSLHTYPYEEGRKDRAGGVELSLLEGWDDRPLTSEPRHVRVLWIEEPQHQAMVSWTTDLPGESHWLYLDTERRRGRAEAYARRVRPTRSGPFALTRTDLEMGVRPSHFHHVHLTDLEPDTVYYLMVVSDGEASREFHFRTAPAEDRPLKMVFGGDSRIAGHTPYFHQDRRAVNRQIAALFEVHDDIYGFIHGGDFTQLAQWRFFDPWLTDHELTTTQNGRLLPTMPVRGNHDRDVGFEEVFWWPGQEGRYYYRTRLTPRITILTLNTEISLGGSQRRWLAAELARARPDSRWLVASYHRPAWPSVRGFSDGADKRRFWVPLFEEHRIDLGLESHDHALKRTVPILNNAEHPDGIVYIGDGGLGVPQRNPDTTRWYLQPPGMALSSHHVHVLDFGFEELRGTAYSIGGEILDEFARPLRHDRAYAGTPVEVHGVGK